LKEVKMGISIKEIEAAMKEAYNDGLSEGARKYRHLCSSCSKEIPTCDGIPEFGDGFGQDNVYNCDKYVQKDVQKTSAEPK